jgi:hypothetical protein
MLIPATKAAARPCRRNSREGAGEHRQDYPENHLAKMGIIRERGQSPRREFRYRVAVEAVAELKKLT